MTGEGQNREQIDYWNGPRAASWVAEQELRDRSLAPFGEAVFAVAAATAGEWVIDVGCGCGATTLALAVTVGASGRAHGIDISAPMLARARERAAAIPQATFTCADATTYAFDGQASLVYSRFGVMFFEDPSSAFKNLRRALVPDGRLAFVCWRGLAENVWMSVPLAAAMQIVPTLPAAYSADAPGPLALADPARTRALMEGAGFSKVELVPFDHPMPLGDGQGLDAAAAEALTLGPAARLLTGASDEVRARAQVAVRAALAPHAKGGNVALPSAAWIVNARAA